MGWDEPGADLSGTVVHPPSMAGAAKEPTMNVRRDMKLFRFCIMEGDFRVAAGTRAASHDILQQTEYSISA